MPIGIVHVQKWLNDAHGILWNMKRLRLPSPRAQLLRQSLLFSHLPSQTVGKAATLPLSTLIESRSPSSSASSSFFFFTQSSVCVLISLFIASLAASSECSRSSFVFLSFSISSFRP